MITEVNRGNFNDEVLRADTPVLAFFTADWCAPCRVLKPVLVELATEKQGEIKICSIDVTKYEDIAARWQVKALPTVIVFQNGEEIDRFWGPKSKQDVVEILNFED